MQLRSNKLNREKKVRVVGTRVRKLFLCVNDFSLGGSTESVVVLLMVAAAQQMSSRRLVLEELKESSWFVDLTLSCCRLLMTCSQRVDGGT